MVGSSLATYKYHLGRWLAGETVDVAIGDDGLIEISQAGKLLRVHPVKRDPSKAHRAFANPEGKPNRINAAS